jgi:predicted flap endonuclease-1-like 5' DNA nuclease
MFNETPLTAYALCYGPLALTVLGFIFFAVLTDLNARRTYLRTGIKDGVEPGKKGVDVETPAGPYVSILPPESMTTVEAAPPTRLQETTKPDNLTRLEGIGPKIAQALIDYGINTFAKVAASSEDDFRAALTAAGMDFAPSMESWTEQASYAASGDWDGLQKLQDTLSSGRYPKADED